MTGGRVAFVIGNGAYTHVKALPNPSNDACSLAKSLCGIGFAVAEGIDLVRAGMQATNAHFLREAARSQVATVDYTGHGVQVDGRLSRARRCAAQTRAGTGRAIEAGIGLATPTSLKSGSTLGAGTLIGLATSPGKVALDGEGTHGPFSAALSRPSARPGSRCSRYRPACAPKVVAATRNQQVPWSNSLLLGEVYLAAK